MKFSRENAAKDLAKGAGIIFVGITLTYIFKFVYRILVSRYLGPEGYGLLSLGDMIMNLGYLIGLIGLDVGLMKHLAYFYEKKDLPRMKGAFWGTIIVSTLVSFIVVALTIIFSNYIAVGLFKNPSFAPILIVFAVAIPFSIFARVISQTMLSFKKQSYDILAKALGRDFVGLVIALIVVVLGGSLFHISLAYLIAFFISVVLGYVILEKKIYPFLRDRVKPIFEYKKRIMFALPLFFSAVFINVMLWADTFFLGYLTSAEKVGIYNAALPLAAGFGIFLASFARVFYPILAGMIAKKHHNEAGEIYYLTSRWIFLLSFPVLILFITLPTRIISFFFGSEFVAGSSALVILSLAYFTNIIVGPTTETLISFGRTKTVFWLNSLAVVGNIVLNVILIPLHGMTGAAIATAVGFGIREIISFVIVRKLVNLQIRLLQYLKYIVAGIVAFTVSVLIYNLSKIFVAELAGIIIFLLIFGSVYLILLFITKALSKQDLETIDFMMKKIGINIKFISNRIQR